MIAQPGLARSVSTLSQQPFVTLNRQTLGLVDTRQSSAAVGVPCLCSLKGYSLGNSKQHSIFFKIIFYYTTSYIFKSEETQSTWRKSTEYGME
jgi:hypothetical protein